MTYLFPANFGARIHASSKLGKSALTVAPSADAIRRFDSVLTDLNQKSEPEAGRPGSTPAVDGSQAQWLQVQGEGLRTIGDRILGSLERLSSNYIETLVPVVGRSVDGPAVLPIERYLSLQVAVITKTVGIDLAAQIIRRSTQNIDQLVRTT